MADIFVFGSNLAGIHGAGSARAAYERHGAEWGIGFGRRGNSFAIPTKDYAIKTLPLDIVAAFVDVFINYARIQPGHIFNVVKIGCGLAGFTEEQIAPLFRDAPGNVVLPEGWRELGGLVRDAPHGDPGDDPGDEGGQ